MKRLWLLPVLLAAALLPTSGLPSGPAPATAAGSGVFAVDCTLAVRRSLDPIMAPGKLGASHLHEFYGSARVAMRWRPKQLAASRAPRTCTGKDPSSYWLPAAYVGNQLVEPDQLQAYYYLDAGAVAMPYGLAMVSGGPGAGQQRGTWSCQPSSNYGQPKAPSCAAGQWLLGEVDFPSCWDGRRLDSANHFDHVAYPASPGSPCPASHPVRLPRLVLFRSYSRARGQLRLSSGDTSTLHADFVSGWRQARFEALMQRCGTLDCGHL